MQRLKVAIIHDWLTTWGGAEVVVKSIVSIFPNADLYTLVHDKEFKTERLGFSGKLYTSFIQRIPFSSKRYRSMLPFFPLAIEQFDLSGYDLIISSSSCVAKGVLTNPNQIHVCYCHTPVRYAWDLQHQYLKEANLNSGIKGFLAKSILHYIRVWDVISSPRVDHFIANSNYISKRIKKIYGRDSSVIYPPVDVAKFEVNLASREEFYVTASRLVPYKKIDEIVKAFGLLPDKKLVVIGDGPDWQKINNVCPSNVEMKGFIDDNLMISYFRKAKAFVFAADEDFGILPVEAQACGTPVIAYGKGGALETVVENVTGVFFNKQESESIKSAILSFEHAGASFDPSVIRKHAETFSKERFVKQIHNFVEEKKDKGNCK